MLKLPATTSQDDYIPYVGGLDLLSPPLSLKPGFVREALNFEASISGGYTRIPGYERFDGRARPSDAVYATVIVDLMDPDALDAEERRTRLEEALDALEVGAVITGATSGATGVVIYRSPSPTGPMHYLLAYTKAVGDFEAAEDVTVLGSPWGTVVDLGGSEDGGDFDARMLALAADAYRPDIEAVPGAGPVLGVVYIGTVVYAFRNNAGNTAAAIYRATGSGWVLVPLFNEVAFTGGSVPPVEGANIEQGPRVATVKRVCLEGGDWTAGTASGRLIVTTPSSSSFVAGVLTVGGTLSLSGAQTAITIAPGGAYEFSRGAVDFNRRVFGVSGVDRAFEFDGETYVPIDTGNSPDTPQRVMVHQGHLFIAIDSSLQHSGIGTAYNWTVLAGSGELGADGPITALQRMPGSQATGAALIGLKEGSQMLYGTSGANFQLVSFEDSSGVKPRSTQMLGEVYVLDDRGAMSLTASQNFGNFDVNTLTLKIRPWIQQRRNQLTCTAINREKSQYRLFFADGSALYITLVGGKVLGAMPMQLLHPALCVCQGETPDGNETAFFGSDDGYVYRMDAGTSFDGEAIECLLIRNPAFQRAPMATKRYRRTTFEIQSDSYVSFNVSFEFSYGTQERGQQDADATSEVLLRSARWDQFTWDQFVFDGRGIAPEPVGIDGSGENIVTRIAGLSAICAAFTINQEIITYSMRRRTR